ncbi:Putative CoA binding protein [Sodalis praecaptivus]|uniref:Putative CoA binding protein n=1 Tax=Sodalis praecaptivus TaxID=1239307 RepID=W0HZH9_9GAMM|nr:CoA-binding protein [Sodalis praecaptivus]AHF77615.1 Putative CoA binding protein [Sodalis praecaptivus]
MTDAEISDILQTVKTIALVGASDNPARPSHGVMAYLLAHGYQVYPVNPALAGKTLLGQTVYANLAAIPAKIDMVDVFRRADTVYDLTQEAIAIDADVLWLQLGIINEQAAVLAKNVGMKVVMDRCPKIEIPRLGLDH